MDKSRRGFLKTGGALLTGTALAPIAALSSGKLISSGATASFQKAAMPTLLGMQLYTVRDDMNKDCPGTLQKLAVMGCKYVEHAGYWNRKFYGHTAKEFKALLDGLGLKMVSGHTSLSNDHWDKSKNDFTDTWKYIVEDAATVGQQYVITPAMDESWRKDYDTVLYYMDVFNKSGELCKKSGMKFGYHNHNFEFKTLYDGRLLYDVILQHTDPALVAHEMDMGNMYGAGGRALDNLKKYPGRYELMHVKDEIAGTNGMDGYESTLLGKGVVKTKEVVDEGRRTGGTHVFIIEQEAYQDKTPLESAKEDLATMKKWGY
ncbi:MAG: TIM barrel protein [Puia sp.]|nr:TIM barrel protein [Puia sp.]